MRILRRRSRLSRVVYQLATKYAIMPYRRASFIVQVETDEPIQRGNSPVYRPPAWLPDDNGEDDGNGGEG